MGRWRRRRLFSGSVAEDAASQAAADPVAVFEGGAPDIGGGREAATGDGSCGVFCADGGGAGAQKELTVVAFDSPLGVEEKGGAELVGTNFERKYIARGEVRSIAAVKAG